MLFEGIASEFREQLDMILAFVPGDTLKDKTELLANLVGIAGFVLSVGLVTVRFASRRGRRRLATQGDLDRLGLAVLDGLQKRIVDQLVAKEAARLAHAAWLSDDQREDDLRRVRLDLAGTVGEIVRDQSDAGLSATAGLLAGDTQPAERYYEGKAGIAMIGRSQPDRAAEALHKKAALQSLSNPVSAVEACLRAVMMNPNDPLGWSRLGHLYLRLGKLSEAQSAFERAVIVQGGAVVSRSHSEHGNGHRFWPTSEINETR